MLLPSHCLRRRPSIGLPPCLAIFPAAPFLPLQQAFANTHLIRNVPSSPLPPGTTVYLVRVEASTHLPSSALRYFLPRPLCHRCKSQQPQLALFGLPHLSLSVLLFTICCGARLSASLSNDISSPAPPCLAFHQQLHKFQLPHLIRNSSANPFPSVSLGKLSW